MTSDDVLLKDPTITQLPEGCPRHMPATPGYLPARILCADYGFAELPKGGSVAWFVNYRGERLVRISRRSLIPRRFIHPARIVCG